MWVVLKVSQVMVTMRPASAASEAVTSHGLFGVSKNIEGSIFQSQDRTSNLFSDLDLGEPETSDPASKVIRGRKFKKCVFFHSEGSTPSGTYFEGGS